MFKKDITPSTKTKLKSSLQRGVRSKVVATYPLLAPHIDDIIPKKAQLDVIKLPEARATLYALPAGSQGPHPTPLFYQHMDDALVPHLALIHRYPDHFPRIRVDRGAIRFVLSGAALMVPGFTSPGGRLPSGDYAPPPPATSAQADKEDGDEADSEDELPDGAAAHVPLGTGKTPADDARFLDQPELEAGTVVVVEAEGKDNACAVGILKMGTKEMKESKKGIGIENGHYLGDGLWRAKID